jgi:chaperonin GroES
MAKLKPLHDRVLIKRVNVENKTKGGIIIPDSAKEKPLEGVVTAVGSGKILENGKIQPLSLKIGDRVLFSKYVETEINLNNEKFLLIKEDDILGILI